MGGNLGGGGKGDVNVELNIVPFIDLMSCLTAFLLVTAVWVNIAQINIQPKGKTRESTTPPDEEIVRLSVLVQSDRIWVGLSRVNEFQEIPNKGDKTYDWDKYELTLKDKKASAFFNGTGADERFDIEIAGESTAQAPVLYQNVVKAMDLAVKVGFKDVGLSDAAGLSAKPSM